MLNTKDTYSINEKDKVIVNDRTKKKIEFIWICRNPEDKSTTIKLTNENYILIEADGTLFSHNGETEFGLIFRFRDGSTIIKLTNRNFILIEADGRNCVCSLQTNTDCVKSKFKANKHAHLYDVFNDHLECEKNEKLLRKIEVEGLQYVNDSSGDFIQCILWLDICDDIQNGLQEFINALKELDKTGQQPLDAFGDASIEQYKLQQTLINHLSDFMVKNDLDFIFI